MSWVGVAGTAISVGGSIYGASEAKSAAGRGQQAAGIASQQQVQGLLDAISERRRGTSSALGYLQQLSPFADMGMGAQGTLSNALGINGADAQNQYFSNFQNDPGYQATLRAGTDAIEQSQSGGGLLRSGGTLKGLQDYGQRLMGGMFSDRLNRLAGLGQSGQSAATTMATGSAGLVDSSTNQLANFYRDIGSAQAGGTLNASNADQRGTQNMLTMLGYGMGSLNGGMGGMGGGANDMFGKIGGYMNYGSNPFGTNGQRNPFYGAG